MNVSDWKSRIADLGCVLCWHLTGRPSPATLHHVREGQGLSQRAPDWLVIPLCCECHQGKNGLHGLGTRGFYQRYKLDELDLLALTLERMAKGV